LQFFIHIKVKRNLSVNKYTSANVTLLLFTDTVAAEAVSNFDDRSEDDKCISTTVQNTGGKPKRFCKLNICL